jgi:hypothetical protein
MPKTLSTHSDRASICYFVAYFLIPRYAEDDAPNLLAYFARDPDYTARFLYMMGCKMNEAEPNEDDFKSTTGHSGTFENGWSYNIIAYPKFPAVNMLAAAQRGEVNDKAVLAPYFSAMLFREPGKIDYCTVLGQSPMGATTFRQAGRNFNANLGPGCEPTLPVFTQFLQHNLGPDGKLPDPVAGVMRSPAEDRKS